MVNLHLFWDGASAPTGWTIVSDAGGAFYQNMIRGNSTYGGTGGLATHTHTTSLVSCTGPSATDNYSATTAIFPSNSHTHPIGSIAADSQSNLPNYRTLKVIKCNSAGNPATIPTGAIVIFDSSTMTGYTRYSVQDNLHIYCDGTTGTTAGSNTHSHTVSGTTGTPSSTSITHFGSAVVNISVQNHTHTYSQTADTQSNEPPYVTAYLGKQNIDGAPTVGIIGMWDGTPPSEWTVLSNLGGVFYQNVIKPANSYNSTGGNLTHSHADVSNVTSDSASTTKIAGAANLAAIHNHTIVISLQTNVPNIAPYIDVIFAKMTSPLPLPLPLLVFNTIQFIMH